MNPRVIVNTVAYNEEQWITSFLDNIRRIRDIWAVNILDGSWQQEINHTVNSTDRTKILVQEWIEKNHVPFEVNFIESDKVWKSESHKRNALLKLTEMRYGAGNWVFVLDTDEVVKFPNGLAAINIIPYLKDQQHCGVIKAHPYNAIGVLPSIRFIPTCKGVHYHTERAMILHDKDCNLLMDYNPDTQVRSEKTFDITDMVIVNYWTLRNRSRMFKKIAYWTFQEKQDKELKCLYQTIA